MERYTTSVLLAVLLCHARLASGQTAQEPRVAVETGATYENLTNGYAPWRRAYLSIMKPFEDRKVVYGSIEEHSRFSQLATELTAGAYYPLNEQWTLVGESAVTSHNTILYRWAAFGQVQRRLAHNWGTHIGVRHRHYESADVDIGSAVLERYVKTFRFAYTAYASHLTNTPGLPITHRFEANIYYGDSAVNLNAAHGTEVENVLPAGVLRSKVSLLNLSGQHWFRPSWAVSYGAEWERQGTSYIRTGVTVGIRHRL